MITLNIELDHVSYTIQLNIYFNNFYSYNRSYPFPHRSEKNIKIQTPVFKFRIETWRL